jgi:hypothetical protein
MFRPIFGSPNARIAPAQGRDMPTTTNITTAMNANLMGAMRRHATQQLAYGFSHWHRRLTPCRPAYTV